MNGKVRKNLAVCLLGGALVLTTGARAADEWGGTGPEIPLAAAGDAGASADNGGDAMFKNLFGPDFKIKGGSFQYLPDRKAVLLRDYPTVLVQGRRIRARNILYFTELNRLYAEGEVSVEEKNGSFLTCDQVYFDVRDGRGRARGVNLRKTDLPVNSQPSVEETDVTLYRPGVADATPGFMDAFTADGDSGVEKTIRMNMVADDLRMISNNHFEATHAWASPSNYAEPHWRIESAAVHVRPDEKVEAYHNLFKIGKIPVFYFPYLIYDLRYNWPYYRPSVGTDKDHGFYFLNRLGWEFTNPVDDEGRAVDDNGKPVRRYFQLDTIFADFDFRSKRGWGLGGETDYSVDFLGKGKGNFKGYWIKEIYTSSHDDRDRAEDDTEFRTESWPKLKPSLYADDNRYLLEWTHAHALPYGFDLRAQIHSFSDRDFYKEYFPDYWAKQEDKKTNANLRYLGNLFSSELTVQTRLNNFRTETEYLPNWKLTLPGVRLFDSLPLYLESNTDATIARRLNDSMMKKVYRLDERNADGSNRYIYQEYRNKKGKIVRVLTPRNELDGESPWIGRLHEEAKLSLPVDFSIFTVRPWFGGFLTGYTNSLDPKEFKAQGDAKLNGAVKWGVDISTRFFGELGDNWTHVIEPTLALLNHEDPITKREYLFELDDIDNYRSSRTLTFGLHQDFYKRTDSGKERKIVSADFKVGGILDNDEARKYNNSNNLSDVSFDVSLYPKECWSLWGNIVYSPGADEVTRYAAGTDFWFNKRMRAFVNHYYNSGFRERYPDIPLGKSHLTTLGIRTQLWDKLSHYAVEYGFSYQWADNAGEVLLSDNTYGGEIKNGMQMHRISLIRDLDTFEASVNYAHDFNDNNWTIYVHLVPKNWVGVKRVPDAGTSVTLDQDWNRYAHPSPDRQVNEYQYDASTPSWR